MKRLYVIKLVFLIAMLSSWDLGAFAYAGTGDFKIITGFGNSDKIAQQTNVAPSGVTQIVIDISACDGYLCCPTPSVTLEAECNTP